MHKKRKQFGKQASRIHPIRTAKRKKKNIIDKKGQSKEAWDKIKHINIHIIGIPEEERKKGTEKIFEQIMAKNFPNLVKEIDTHVQEAQGVPNKMKPKRPS